MKLLFLIGSNFFINCLCFCQSESLNERYQKSYNLLDSMLSEPSENQFKKAVFLVENTYINNTINNQQFEDYIDELTSLAQDWMAFNHLNNYKFSDSLQVLKNFAIYIVLKDTIEIFTRPTSGLAHIPYLYDFDDSFGNQDWKNMFVTKLLAIHSGNCHSLPYLYKILSDDLGATCWLALSPNHMYIQNRCKKSGWYNTELTSGDFPIMHGLWHLVIFH